MVERSLGVRETPGSIPGAPMRQAKPPNQPRGWFFVVEYPQKRKLPKEANMNRLILIAAALLLAVPLIAADKKKSEPEAPRNTNEIAFKFYSAEAKKPGNLFFSPYSMYSAFAMAYEGAKGDTAKEMAGVFGFPVKTRDLRALVSALGKDIEAAAKGALLTQANSFWAQKDFRFKPAYMKTLRSDYSGEAMTADFKGNTEQARKQINSWAENRTRGKIRGLFPENSLDTLTRLVLVNAVYFKGSWEFPFDRNFTAEADFTRSDGTKVKAMMMGTPQEKDALYGENADLQALRLPYRSRGLSMLLLLPREGKSLAGLEKQLNSGRLDAIRKEMFNRKVKVFMPRFGFSSGMRLNSALASLGMPTAFTDSADFSPMTGKKDLYIQNAFHKAFIEVNEEGTEAAAATGVAMGLKSMVLDYSEFRADRPFLFLVEEEKTGTILFMGRVEDPNQK